MRRLSAPCSIETRMICHASGSSNKAYIYGNYSSLRIRCLIMYQSRLCFEIAVPTAVLRSTSTAACYLPRGGRCRWLLRTGVTVLFYFFAHTYTLAFRQNVTVLPRCALQHCVSVSTPLGVTATRSQ